MNDKLFLVIVWGRDGLINEIGFINFCMMAEVAVSISPKSYAGWFTWDDTACIVIPVEKGIGKAIDTIFANHSTADLRIMPKVMVDNVIVRG